jgi:murein DD-endopeptidase MepM/ murein hydrolase activator NlpD
MVRHGRGFAAAVVGAAVLSGCAGGRATETAAPRLSMVVPVFTSPAPIPHVDPAPALILAAPEPPAAPAPPPPPRARSQPLRSGFYNPMPGGVMAGYQADTGLDIAGSPRPVYAIAAGTLDYSEPGHTLWTGPSDTPNCVRFELDTPIPHKGRMVTHVYYAHLSKLETLQHEGDPERRHVEAGEVLGWSGVARHSPHLHIGLLLDGDVSQRYWGTFLLADEIRAVLGGYKNGDRLPREPGAAR